MSMPPETSEQPQVVDGTRARQGRLGRPIMLVLIIGTVLAAAGTFLAWGSRSGDLQSTEAPAQTVATDAEAFDAPEPAPVNAQPPTATQPPPVDGGSTAGQPTP